MKSATSLAIFLAASLFAVAADGPVLPFESLSVVKTPATTPGKIDGFIFAKLKRLGIQPANPCSDAVFVRRVYLDVIGTLPTADEATGFLSDKDPGKRAALIDRLLERDEFADYLGMKWCDLLRVKSEFPVNLWPEAAQAYDHWVRSCIHQNIPYSKFASEILTANGSNFRVPQVNFFRSAGSKDPQ
ncbi:MAG: DUF1549 domain-containing protein, partial [Verrucomicrobiota bacterium]